jgi:hypothetical protein
MGQGVKVINKHDQPYPRCAGPIMLMVIVRAVFMRDIIA